MRVKQIENGFTVAEMVVALVIMSLFLNMFFQMYMASVSQRTVVTARAAANEIAATNLKKIGTKTQLPASTPACASGGGIIATTGGSGTDPKWVGDGTPSSGLEKESITGSSLPTTAVQTLSVSYPHGCGASMPAKITSTVTFGSETVNRATYVN